ncbi:MAG: hypothetical protein WC455_25635 [Dehalococcoidia bacterium]|jgi:hypothetical protein
MPTPRPGEKEGKYVDRAIPMLIDEGTAKDGAQAAAIAHSMYRQHQKKMGKYGRVKRARTQGPED